MILCIAGKNQIAVEAARQVRQTQGGLELCVATNQTDTGHDTWQPSLLQFARTEGIRIAELAELHSRPDLVFVSLEYDRLLRPAEFSTRQLYNIHFSLLPEYKGMFTSIWPILDGKDYSGVTLHEIDAGIDTGGIIAQTRFTIGPDMTSKQLYETYQRHGLALFLEWLPRLLEGRAPARPQSAIGSSYRSKQSLDFKSLRIDLRQTAAAIHNQVRAFTFRDYQLPAVLGRSVSASTILPALSNCRPGTLLREDHGSFDLATVDYDIRLHIDPLDALLRHCEAGNEAAALEQARRLDDLETRNRHGWTALMIAAYHNLPSLVDQLLRRGAFINARNYKGTTVLMFAKGGAIRSGNCATLKLLLDADADASLRDHSGRTVLEYARAEHADAVVRLLEAHPSIGQARGSMTPFFIS